MSRLLLTGGRVICPATDTDRVADVLCEDDRIVAVGGFDPAGVDAARVDCSDRVVAPSLVDLDALLCDPGETWREDLSSGTTAAAAGGYTAVLASPASRPVTDDPAVVRDLLDRSAELGRVQVLATAALTVGLKGEALAEVGLLLEAGASVVGNGEALVDNSAILRNALLYARPYDRPVLLRAGDQALEATGSMHEGKVSGRAGLHGMPAAAEELGIGRLIALARNTGATVHVTGLTTAQGVQALDRARSEGLQVSGSTHALHLLLTDQAVLDSTYDTHTRLHPPLRSESDRQALLSAVRDGTLLAVTSQHCPWTRAEKELEFERARPGAVGLETALGTVLAAIGDLSTTLRVLSAGPASVLGLDRRVSEGAPAELVVFDPDGAWTVQPDAFCTKGRNTPLAGRSLPGPVLNTIHRGRVVHGPEPVIG